MSLRNRNKTYDWARFGGIEEDESLDVAKYEVEIQFPIRSFDSNTKIYTFEPVPIDLNDDLFVAPPSSVYHIDGEMGIIECSTSENLQMIGNIPTLEKIQIIATE